MSVPITVLIVDDHSVVRAGLSLLLASKPNLRVVAEAASREVAKKIAAETRPQVAVLDLMLGGDDGLDVLADLKALSPETKVLILTAVDDSSVHVQAVRSGALGIVHKSHAAEDLVAAIETVARGQSWFDRAFVTTLLAALQSPSHRPGSSSIPGVDTLTPREQEVISLVCEGLRNRAIADRLTISENTVRHHLTSIFNKLKVNDRLELAVFSQKHGLARR